MYKHVKLNDIAVTYMCITETLFDFKYQSKLKYWPLVQAMWPGYEAKFNQSWVSLTCKNACSSRVHQPVEYHLTMNIQMLAS